MVASARLRWAPIEVDDLAFVRFVAHRIPESSADLIESLNALHTDALYLTCACAQGNEAAITRFELNFFEVARPTLLRIDQSGALYDDAMQTMRERLFVAAPGGRAKVVDYMGRGPLRSWVRAVAVRIGLDLSRKEKSEQARRENEDILDALPDSTEDPELAYLREHYGEALRESLAAALHGLPAQDRGVLRCHYVDQLNIEQIGRIFQVHKTTAHRRLLKARAALIESTRTRMKRSLGVATQEIDSVMRLVDNDLNLSLRRLLQPE